MGAGDLAYGLVAKGAISASGVYDKVTATGVSIGAGGGKVGDLRFVGECQVGSGINDCRTKVVDFEIGRAHV